LLDRENGARDGVAPDPSGNLVPTSKGSSASSSLHIEAAAPHAPTNSAANAIVSSEDQSADANQDAVTTAAGIPWVAQLGWTDQVSQPSQTAVPSTATSAPLSASTPKSGATIVQRFSAGLQRALNEASASTNPATAAYGTLDDSSNATTTRQDDTNAQAGSGNRGGG